MYALIGKALIGQATIGRGSTADVPGAPTVGTPVDNHDGSVDLDVTQNVDNGGAAVTLITVTSSAGGVQGTAVPVGAGTTTVNIPAVVDSVSQTFTAHCTNLRGDSDESSASSAITPTNTSVVTQLVDCPFLPTDGAISPSCQAYRIASNALVAVGSTRHTGFNSSPNITNAKSILMSLPPSVADGSWTGILVFGGFSDASGNSLDAIELTTPRAFALSTCSVCKLAPFAATDLTAPDGDPITDPGYQLFDKTGQAVGSRVSGASIVAIPGVFNGFATQIEEDADVYGGLQLIIEWDDGGSPPRYYRDIIMIAPPLATNNFSSGASQRNDLMVNL